MYGTDDFVMIVIWLNTYGRLQEGNNVYISPLCCWFLLLLWFLCNCHRMNNSFNFCSFMNPFFGQIISYKIRGFNCIDYWNLCSGIWYRVLWWMCMDVSEQPVGRDGFLLNIGICLSDYMMSHLVRQQPSNNVNLYHSTWQKF